MVTKNNLEDIQWIFLEATKLPTEKREKFVEEKSNNNQAIKKEVLELLSYHQEKESFLDKPIFEKAVNLLQPQASTKIEYIGFYKVVKELGCGGMATVYLAERNDEQYKQKVAIKLIQPALVTETLTKMFVSERQIMANLNHNNIAKLLDGGVTDYGSPYLVMEYIDGLPIDQFCNSLKMSIVERIKLFSKVCLAVQFAHQNLVVHRDIKPNNILVTSDGTPKLLDFGVAKLINHTNFLSTYTQPQNRFLTPVYASPEQISGQAITTTTDVYSLGVLLYELITGRLPYKFSQTSPDEIKRVICEVEPIKPSQIVLTTQENFFVNSTLETPKKLSKTIKGDLETIMLKALSKEPNRRYSSVESLLEDLNFYLTGLPIKARKESLSYFLSKFVKRNKLQVVAASLLFLTLLGGIIATSWQAHRANLAQAKAEKRFNDVRKLANSLLFEFNGSIEKLPGSTATRQLLITRATEYLDSLSQESTNDPSLQRELATSYQKLSLIQGNLNIANLGKSEDAIKSQQKAIFLLESLLKFNSNDLETRQDLASSYGRYGQLLVETGKSSEAVNVFQKAIQTLESTQIDKLSNQAKLKLAVIYRRFADTLCVTGDLSQAIEKYYVSVSLCENLTKLEPENRDISRALAAANGNLGVQLLANGNSKEAIERYLQVEKIYQSLLQRDFEVGIQRNLSVIYDRIAETLISIDKLPLALEKYEQALKIRIDFLAKDPTNAQAERDVSGSYSNLGYLYLLAGDFSESLKFYSKALEIDKKLASNDVINTRYIRDVATNYRKIGELLTRQEKHAEAIKNYDQSKTILDKIISKDPTNKQAISDRTETIEWLSRSLVKLNRNQEAYKYTSEALKIRFQRANEANTRNDFLYNAAWMLLTCEPQELQDPKLALEYAEKAVAKTEEKSVLALRVLALAYKKNNKHKDATEIAKKALNLLEKLENGDKPSLLRKELQQYLF